MVDATPDEQQWIKEYVARHPDVLELPYRTPAQWDDIRRNRGEEALRQAEAALDTGDTATALNCLDEARAHGVLSTQEWQSTRQHVHSAQRPASSSAAAGPPHPSPRPCLPTDDELAARRAHVRQRQLLLAIEQHAPGYHRATGDGVRYAAEHVNATREEWDWMAANVRSNPHLLDGEPIGDGRAHDINRQAARDAFDAATDALKAGDYRTALDRLDDAEVHHPDGNPDTGSKPPAAGASPVSSPPPAALARINHPLPINGHPAATDPAVTNDALLWASHPPGRVHPRPSHRGHAVNRDHRR